VALQVYVALIASVLVSLWTGRKPTKRTDEMLCFYFSGMASLEELPAHLEKPREKLKTEPRGTYQESSRTLLPRRSVGEPVEIEGDESSYSIRSPSRFES